MDGKEVGLPKETIDFFDGDELRARIFYEKYTARDETGTPLEKTPIEMWHRVAGAIASAEESEDKRKEWEEKFYWLLENFRFVPGGRILFGAGQKGRKVTLINCYVIPLKEDTIESIFDWCKESARTYSYGGGVGTDISVLRPKGSPVHNAALESTGSVSFMEIMSETTGVIGQAGRRGALMITIRVDHPDIYDFIKVKRNMQSVRHANISVRVTDEFMRAVEEDGEITLWFESDVIKRIEKKVKARELWNEIIQSARDWAEPGVIFWDTMKRGSPTEYNGMNIITTNPCSEQPLQPYGACDLGHVNLVSFVNNPFESNASIDWANLEKAIRYSVRFLDNVLTYNADKHPLPAQKEASLSSRRIGLGVTGFADMLAMLGIKYDSEEALKFTDELFEKIKSIAYDESIELAKEKSPFPLFDVKKHMTMPFVQTLNTDIKRKIEKYGLRNAAVLTIAPVGSGSVLLGVSSAIEPIFAFSYIRRSESLSKEEFKVYHPLVEKYMKKFGISDEKDLPEYFVEAHKINPEFRVRMQGIIQKHIDSAISSTVNLPESATTEEIGNIYMLAWKVGCKGITVYREGSREGILITENKEKKEKSDEVKFSWERPKELVGETIVYRLSNGNIYITANKDEGGYIKEVFVNLGKSGSDEKTYSEAIGRLISLYLQHGGDVHYVIKSLKGIQGRSVVWDHGIKLLSVPDAIAKALQTISSKSQQAVLAPVLTQDARQNEEPAEAEENDAANAADKKANDEDEEIGISDCPQCGEHTLVNENGCVYCTNCGYSKC